MKIFNSMRKIIGQIFFVILFLSTPEVKSLDKFDKADNVSDYFSGILLLNDNQYENSFKYLKKLNGLERSHKNYSVKYLYSLVNSGNLKEAFDYSKRLEKQKLDSFESHIISGIFYLKNSKIDLAQKYFSRAKNFNKSFILNNYVSNSLYNWSNLSNLNQAILDLEKLDRRFENLKKIQNVFLHCYFESQITDDLFSKILSDKKTDFSRYNYFYATYLASIGRIDGAKEIIDKALRVHPRNLLLNQYKIDLSEKKNISIFDCNQKEHVVAEILYIAANALSSQSIYSQSNFFFKFIQIS